MNYYPNYTLINSALTSYQSGFWRSSTLICRSMSTSVMNYPPCQVLTLQKTRFNLMAQTALVTQFLGGACRRQCASSVNSSGGQSISIISQRFPKLSLRRRFVNWTRHCC